MRPLVLAALVLVSCRTKDSPQTDDSLPDSPAVEVDEDGDGVPADQDCDDTNPGVNPNAAEICDNLDNNCDGTVDEDAADAGVWYTDADGDGYGEGEPLLACTQPEGTAAQDGDCDDSSASWFPGAPESDCADPNDYNCDGSVGYADADGDGWAACTECDDTDPAIRPDAAEVCDGLDNNCDGSSDEGVTSTFYADADADGYGDADYPVESCSEPEGYTADATDCDDTDPDTWPGAAEICDSEDDDCDSAVDEGVLLTWYADTDADGYGVSGSSTLACSAPSGYAAYAGDCDDADGAYNPGAAAGCDGEDYNCDGAVDNDADGDTYADDSCGGTDCDDSDASIVPEADGSCALGGTCLDLYAAGYTSSGTYSIDPDGYGVGLSPFDVSCDMSTDGGGWTLVLHFSAMSGLKENEFISLYAHNRFTDETWSFDRSTGTVSGGLASGGLVSGSTQGALGASVMDGLWDDLRMACNASDDTLTESSYAQVDGYASTNGSWMLLGAAANGTAYTVSTSGNSAGLAKIWHDNETTAHNSNHYLCDTYNTTYTSGGGAPQFGFCYTDHLNNPNTLDYGDSIVSLAFGTVQGGDGWSEGFTMECGNMGGSALQNTGTVWIWVR